MVNGNFYSFLKKYIDYWDTAVFHTRNAHKEISSGRGGKAGTAKPHSSFFTSHLW